MTTRRGRAKQLARPQQRCMLPSYILELCPAEIVPKTLLNFCNHLRLAVKNDAMPVRKKPNTYAKNKNS